MAKTDPTTTMTDEELAELLEERGHTGSATSLRTAERAVAANQPPPLAHDEFAPARRLERAYALGPDGWARRRARRNDLGGGHDGE